MPIGAPSEALHLSADRWIRPQLPDQRLRQSRPQKKTLNYEHPGYSCPRFETGGNLCQAPKSVSPAASRVPCEFPGAKGPNDLLGSAFTTSTRRSNSPAAGPWRPGRARLRPSQAGSGTGCRHPLRKRGASRGQPEKCKPPEAVESCRNMEPPDGKPQRERCRRQTQAQGSTPERDGSGSEVLNSTSSASQNFSRYARCRAPMSTPLRRFSVRGINSRFAIS